MQKCHRWRQLRRSQPITLQWRHNERDGVPNHQHQPYDCLLNRLFRFRSKKTLELRVTGLCEGNSPVTGEFPAKRASDAENVSIWWGHHDGEKHIFSTAEELCWNKRISWPNIPGALWSYEVRCPSQAIMFHCQSDRRGYIKLEWTCKKWDILPRPQYVNTRNTVSVCWQGICIHHMK